MNITVIIESNDAETAWNALRFATTALAYDNRVTIFLLGRGVEVAEVSTFAHDTVEQLELFRSSGGTLIGCGVCCESRKQEMPLLSEQLRCETGSMNQLYALVAESDKVLTF